MESRRGSQDEQVGPKAQADDNVIRLPRDWVGPLEELVPIGRDPEPSDFWSEASAAVQDAVPAPPAIRDEIRRPSRGMFIAAATAFATALLAFSIGGLGPMQSARQLPALAAHSKVDGLAVVLPPGVFDALHGTAPRSHVARHHERSATRPVHRAAPAPSRSPASTTVSVTYTQPAPTPTPGSAEQTAPSDTGAAHGATTNSGSTTSPGPEGPGAPFGPGHLG